MGKTSIEWTDVTWNPLRGCTRVSEGCRHCYAETVAARFSGPGQAYEGLATRGPARWTGKVVLVEKHLTDPLRWREPKRIFVNSMSDLFHDAVPDEWIDRVFAVMALAPQHAFQVLTKRPERMRAYVAEPMPMERALRMFEFMAALRPGVQMQDTCAHIEGGAKLWPNVWLGVSVEDQATADARIPLLLKTPAVVRFVSYEPALGPVDFTNIDGIDRCGSNVPSIDALTGCWAVSRERPPQEPRLHQVIVGGESGPGARPCDVEWIRSVRDQCRAAGGACFVKQVGAEPRETGGDHLYDWPDYDLVENCAARAGVSPAGGQWWAIPLRDRKGGDMEEWPDDLRVREFPAVLR